MQAQKLLFTEPKLLPESINSGSDVDFPAFAPNGSFIFFSRSNDSLNTGGGEDPNDIWFSTFDKEKGTWSKAINSFSTLNNAFENAVVGISANARRLYLHNTYVPANPSKVSLCYTDNLDTAWSEPKLLEIGSIKVGDKPYGVFMYTNESVLFVSMESEGGEGSEDIYVVIKDSKGKWSKPINLGPQINSKGYDFSPFLDHSGEHLYFATDGRGGQGGSDIFVSKRLDSTWRNWSTPVNLGERINTSGDEIYFTMTQRNLAFFSSKPKDKESKFYETSIYFLDSNIVANMPEASVGYKSDSLTSFSLITRLVYKGTDGKPANDVEVLLIDELGNLMQTGFTNEEGLVVFKNLESSKVYTVKVLTKIPDIVIENFTEPILEFLNAKIIAQLSKGETFTTPDYGQKEIQLIATLKRVTNEVPLYLKEILLLSEEGIVLQRGFSDETGRVLFKNIASNKTYRLSAQVDDSILFDVGILEPSLFGSKQLTSKFSTGDIQYDGLAPTFSLIARMLRKSSGSAFPSLECEVFDDNGILLERAITDSNGYVLFKNLNANRRYKIEATNADTAIECITYTTEELVSSKTDKTKRVLNGEIFNLPDEWSKSAKLLSRVERKDGAKFSGPAEIYLEQEDGTLLLRIFCDKEGLFYLKNIDHQKNYRLKVAASEPVFFMIGTTDLAFVQENSKKPEKIGWGVLHIKKDGFSGQTISIKDLNGKVLSSGICDLEGFVRLRNIPSDHKFIVSAERGEVALPDYELLDFLELKKINIQEQQRKSTYFGSTDITSLGANTPLHVHCKLTIGKDGKQASNVPISLINKSGEVVSRVITDPQGEARFLSLSPNFDYYIVLDKPIPNANLFLSYYEGKKILKANDVGKVRPHLGTSFSEKLYFIHNSSEVDYQLNLQSVEKLKLLLTQFPSVSLAIQGHTDQSGSEAYNQALSLKRSSAVKQLLCSKFGVQSDRVTVEGFGDKFPLVKKSSTEELRVQDNRRVELVVKGY
jgi:outer membrane protein OmpA-like peptidoglycan-associated protein